MLRLRYVFLFILITALGSFALGLQVGFSAHRVAAAGKSVENWANSMSVSAADIVLPVSSEDIDAAP